MRPILQNRWKIQDNYIYFYGLRSNPYTFKNKIHLSAMDLETVTYMNGSYDLFTYKISKQIQKLIDEKIIVDKDDLIEYPKSIKEAHFCKKCGLNDFVLPGLELDNNELCPICSNENTMKNFLIPSPEITKINKSANSKYDAAIFYDGSIDSTLLLNYLTNVLNLRILALTIESSNTCDEFINLLDQIEKNFENVKFITKQTDDINNKYNLFYPILIEEKLPYLILSLDDINTDICKINKHNFNNKNIFLYKLINIKRKILRQNPLSKGQVNMLSKINYKDSLIEKYINIINSANKNGALPELVHIDPSLINVNYNEFDLPIINNSNLYNEINDFKEMKTKTIPDTLIKNSILVNLGFISRKQVLKLYSY